jgi:betaine-aldehyde dehydrogenase
MDDVAACFTYFGKLAGQQAGRVVDAGNSDVVSRIVHEPVGVCGLITPWNYPLLQAAWKVAPALAAGNTIILKPAELTPHTAILLMQVLDEVGLPPGVANLVLGPGAVVGAPLVSHPDVDLISFTGGLATGKTVAVQAADTVKKVALELGGKNPNVVFADADFDAAVDNALNAAFVHSGQVCSAGARLIVEESIAQPFVDELVRRARNIRLESRTTAATEDLFPQTSDPSHPQVALPPGKDTCKGHATQQTIRSPLNTSRNGGSKRNHELARHQGHSRLIPRRSP